MSPGAIMIFGAGLGTRMGALTRTQPKPLVKVAGRALIDHALDLTQGLDLRRVVNVHYRADQMRAHLDGSGTIIADETARLLETGGGLRAALPLLAADPVFTLNSDAVWTGANPLRTLAAAWDPARMDTLLLLVPPARAIGHTGRGDFLIDSAGRLTRGPGLVYTGAQILRTDPLHDVEEEAFSLNRLWDRQIPAGRLYGVIHPGGWCDVGRPESIALAETMLEAADAG